MHEIIQRTAMARSQYTDGIQYIVSKKEALDESAEK